MTARIATRLALAGLVVAGLAAALMQPARAWGHGGFGAGLAVAAAAGLLGGLLATPAPAPSYYGAPGYYAPAAPGCAWVPDHYEGPYFVGGHCAY